jgi:hypothetical protein
MYPHSIEIPTESIEEEIQLDTNSILIETNKLVDGQRISNSVDDSDGDAVHSLEKLNTDDINKVPQSPIAATNGRTTHKSENQTRSNTSMDNPEQEANRKKDWRSQQFNSFDDSTAIEDENLFDFKNSLARNNYYSSSRLRKPNNSSDSLLNGDFSRLDDADQNKRREKKSRLPIKIIIGMLKPVDGKYLIFMIYKIPFLDLSENPFEIIIDTARYVCNPWFALLPAIQFSFCRSMV